MSQRRNEVLAHQGFKGIMHSDKVPQGLGHLDIIDVDKAVVHPVVGKDLACFGF